MTIKTSGPLGFNEINAEFNRGTNLNADRGVQWFTDSGASGNFNVNGISFAEFYGKRAGTSFSFWEGVVSYPLRLGFAIAQGPFTLSPSGVVFNSITATISTSTFVCNGQPALTYVLFTNQPRPGTTLRLFIDGVIDYYTTDWVACAQAFHIPVLTINQVANTTRYSRVEVYP